MTTQSRTRPAGNGTGSEVQVDAGTLSTLQPATPANTTDTVRCQICKHPVHARRSVHLGIGPFCLARLAASVVVPGWRVETIAANNGAITLVLVPLAVTP